MAGKSASILINILGDSKSAVDAADKTESRFDQLGAKLGKIGLAVGAGIAAGGVAAVVGLEKLGATFDDAMDSIAVKTGATGDELAGLEGSFKSVFQTVPVSADEASTAIGSINQQLGLTGQPLEALSTQLLNLSRITDTDLATNIESVTGLFNQFGISAEEQGTKLDELFTISQDSGVAVGDLAAAMTDGGSQFREAGFTFEETAGLLGSLGKAGLDASDVLPSLSKVMAKAAESGEDASLVLGDLFADIANAPDDVTAANIAFELLGAKAGPKFAEMIRSGTLSLSDMTGALDDGLSSINDTAAGTDDWREKLQLLMNKGMVALEPIATKVFTKIGELIEWATPYLEEFGEWLQVHLPVAAEKLSKAFEWFRVNVIPPLVEAFEKVSAWVEAHWPQIEQTIRDVLTTVQQVIAGFIDVVQTIWRNFGDQITSFIEGKFQAIMGVIDGALQIIRGIVQTVTSLIHGDWSGAWDGIKQIFDGIWTAMVAAVQGFIDEMRAYIEAVMIIIRGIWDTAWGGISEALSGIWEGMKALVTGSIDAVRQSIEDMLGTIRGIWDTAWGGISDAVSGTWETIKTTVSGGVGLVVGYVLGIPGALAGAAGDVFAAFATKVDETWEGIKQGVSDAIWAIFGYIAGIPQGVLDSLGNGFMALWDAFKEAVNKIIRAWNNLAFPTLTVGGSDPLGDLGPSLPSFSFGGWALPDIDELHTGGVVPGPVGSESLWKLEAGETVRTRAQEASLWGGGFPSHITVQIGEHEFEAVLIAHDDATVTRARQGRR